jgi:biotin carboxylase
MNYVHVSPHFPPNYYLFSVQLARLGAVVLGLGDESYENLRPELRESLTDYYRVNDLHNYDELLRACGYFTHRHGKIARLDSHSEYWMETEARLRTDFNVPGPRMSEMAQFKRKSLMKGAFARAGVTAARGRVCHNLGDAEALLSEVGFPVVAKPDIGVGAANTFRLDNTPDLERFFATKPPVDYIVEEYVEGVICTFDGISDKDGNPVFIGSLQYSQGIMETVNERRDIYFFTQREIPADLEEAGRRVLKEFDIRERFYHLEFFRIPDGRLTALEMNVRPPGGPAVDMYNYACDVDLYWGWANVVLNNRFVDRYSRKYYCCYVSRRYNKAYCHTHDQILLAHGPIIAHHEPLPVVFAIAMGDYTYLLRTPDYDEMLAAAAFIQEPA